MKDETGKEVSGEVDEMQVVFDIVQKNGLVANPPGIYINKVRYHFIDCNKESNAYYLKTDKGGATLVKTNKLILIGTWSQDKH